ncbi:MAG: toxin-antitoxin system YwqK family antitoxin [Bacteroidales bacterium]
MENSLNKFLQFVIIPVVLTAAISSGCNNKKEKKENNGNQQEISTQIDTLGHTMDRVVTKRFDNGNIRTLHYYRDSSTYFERKLWKSGKDYIRGWIENGKREGKWYSWYENGVLWSSGNYENGLRQGKSNLYYDDGSVQQVQEYKNGKPHGTWKFYDKNGTLTLEVDYNEGEKLEERRFGE